MLAIALTCQAASREVSTASAHPQPKLLSTALSLSWPTRPRHSTCCCSVPKAGWANTLDTCPGQKAALSTGSAAASVYEGLTPDHINCIPLPPGVGSRCLESTYSVWKDQIPSTLA